MYQGLNEQNLAKLVKSKFFCNNFRKFNIPHISAIWILHLIADFCVKRKLLLLLNISETYSYSPPANISLYEIPAFFVLLMKALVSGRYKCYFCINSRLFIKI